MDDELDGRAELAEELEDGITVAHVDAAVRVRRAELTLEAGPVPVRRRFGAEEDLSHVVVDADDIQPDCREVKRGLRSDQAARSGDHRYAHSASLRRKGAHADGRPQTRRQLLPLPEPF